MDDIWVEVTYVCYPSGSGVTRMYISALINWLRERTDNVMITQIREL